VGISTYDPGVFAGVTVLLTAIALAAAGIPAHRATRVSPAQSLIADR
jgi:ABC-type lipoprotein release transport system permease subunit